MSYKLRPGTAHLEEIHMLFREYTDSLGIDLSYQDYAAELAALPGKYAPPEGRLYLALWNDAPAGCAALRPLREGICEMKRLYVRPGFRGHSLGRLLAEQLVEDARAAGYRHMVLDSLPALQSAISLYRSMGFYHIPPYYDSPVPGTVYLCLDLSNNGGI